MLSGSIFAASLGLLAVYYVALFQGKRRLDKNGKLFSGKLVGHGEKKLAS
jgi:hypothetical protein